jgi:hypothetical protein
MSAAKNFAVKHAPALVSGFVAAFAGLAALAAPASGPPDAEMTAAAQNIQKSCVARGEDARVCACGIGLGYAQLEPATFKLIPEVEPLLNEPDKFKAISGLVAAGNKRGLSVSDLMTAYDTIKANREVSRGICKPLAAVSSKKK